MHLSTRSLLELHAKKIQSGWPTVSREDIERDGIIVFGAGTLGAIIVSALLAAGIRPEWIIDNNEALHNSRIGECPILPPDSLLTNRQAFVVLASGNIPGMVDDCRKSGIQKWILPSALRHFCPFAGDFGIYQDAAEYADAALAVYDILADALSRDLFARFIRFHHTFEQGLFAEYDPQTYFPHDLHTRMDYSNFIDAGAFTGDTLAAWLKYSSVSAGHSFAYHAFEPGPEQFAKLQSFVEGLPASTREHVFPYRAALGKDAGRMNMCGTGASASLAPSGNGENEDNSTDVFSIDGLFHDDSPTFIKADVEGFELNLLQGAETVIRRCRPGMAISVYHHFADIWEIPLWIHNLNCGYQLYLRHHTPGYDDTVCYAIPAEAQS